MPTRRIAAVVNDDTRVSNDSPACDGSGLPNIKRAIYETPGAMSEQSSDAAHGHDSMPQKLLQLVGYRDPHACAASSHRRLRNGTR
jgi:hypothetical protein